MTMVSRTTLLRDPDHAERFARNLAPAFAAGDTLLLQGPIGAGKTHFARAVIQERLRLAGRWEDVPSPTFTLVQTYLAGDLEIWHADLYRLHSPAEVLDLGLEEAIRQALCLIEWPERMGRWQPAEALHLEFAPTPQDQRMLTVRGTEGRWADLIGSIRDMADG